MKITTLYVKTHNQTGLKYFGKVTNRCAQRYKGSGKYWLNHIKKHGNDVTTDIVFESANLENVEAFALKFSSYNNIVASDDWANLKFENGKDGGTQKEWITEQTKAKMSEKRRGITGRPVGWKHTEGSKLKMSVRAKQRGAPMSAWKPGHIPHNKGTPADPRVILKMIEARVTKTCPHCGKVGKGSGMTRFHFDNCKSITE